MIDTSAELSHSSSPLSIYKATREAAPQNRLRHHSTPQNQRTQRHGRAAPSSGPIQTRVSLTRQSQDRPTKLSLTAPKSSSGASNSPPLVPFWVLALRWRERRGTCRSLSSRCWRPFAPAASSSARNCAVRAWARRLRGADASRRKNCLLVVVRAECGLALRAMMGAVW